MGTLGSSQRDRGVLGGRNVGCGSDGHGLRAQQMDEVASSLASAPIPPQDRLRWGRKRHRPVWRWRWPFDRPQNSAHPAWPLGLFSMQETLVPQWTRTTIGQSCRIEDTHGPIALSSSSFCIEGVIGRAAQRAIWLLGEIRSSELSCAFGLCKLGWPVDERSGFLRGDLLSRIEGIRRLHSVAVVIGVPPLT